MNKLAKILTFWIPLKPLRKKARASLERFFYGLAPIHEDWVVFYDTFSRNGNGDSVRPIAEELRKRRPSDKFFFVTKDQKDIDMADEVLIENSRRFHFVVQRAKFVVSPMDFPRMKRKGQVFIATWHGSPVKRIYLSRDKNDEGYIAYAKQFENADIFCIQGLGTKEFVKEALGLNESQLFKSGYPRNDILFTVSEEFKDNLKQSLGLPLDKKVILYCPTWRRYDWKAPLPLDLKRMKAELGDDYVLLLRSHVGKHAWVDENDKPISVFDNAFVFNGGDYPEATHLYTISDVMVSDYSSAIFDFALTGKPQVLYIYDCREYEKEFGLFYDMETFSPFPTAKNQDELCAAIRNCAVSRDDYAKFVAEHLGYENGTATRQVVDYMCEAGDKV